MSKYRPNPFQSEPWHTPVYNAQCRTWARALELCGIQLSPEQGLATRPGHILETFRAYKQHRSPQAIAMRKRVAESFKHGR